MPTELVITTNEQNERLKELALSQRDVLRALEEQSNNEQLMNELDQIVKDITGIQEKRKNITSPNTIKKTIIVLEKIKWSPENINTAENDLRSLFSLECIYSNSNNKDILIFFNNNTVNLIRTDQDKITYFKSKRITNSFFRYLINLREHGEK